MDNQTEEDLDLELVEEQVLTRWGKIMQWCGMAKTFFTMGKLVWGLVAVTGTAVVVGEATDTRPIRDGAVAIGILDERPLPGTQEVSSDALWDEVMNLQEEVTELQDRDLTHTHEALSVPHSHDLGKHTHPPPEPIEEQTAVVPVLIEHNHDLSEHGHPVSEHTHPELQGTAAGKTEINDAFIRHIKDDH
ncbi:MAG: hypothetical protein ACTSX2_01355 [Candidatus Thorarchaeota archaeon]